MNTISQICYINFIKRLMASAGLPMSQMQEFDEWLENRKNQFTNEADEKEHNLGFESWLSAKYM